MACRLKTLDRDTPMLLPPDLRSWVPENHIVHFLIEAVDRLPKWSYRYNHRGSGSAQYPPEMMLTLLIYSYIAGRFSSRVIEESTHSDVIARYICGGELHPDHDTLCAFRRENRELFTRASRSFSSNSSTRMLRSLMSGSKKANCVCFRPM